GNMRRVPDAWRIGERSSRCGWGSRQFARTGSPAHPDNVHGEKGGGTDIGVVGARSVAGVRNSHGGERRHAQLRRAVLCRMRKWKARRRVSGEECLGKLSAWLFRIERCAF